RLSLLALILLMLYASCSTSSGATRPDSSSLKDCHDLSVPVNLAITSPMQFSTGSVTMYMVKGEEITFTMRFLGMAVGAIHITPDSLLAYSVPQRVYVAEDLTSALGGVAIPLADLQALLIGQSTPAFDRLPAMSGGTLTVGTLTDPATGAPESLDIAQSRPERSLRLLWSRAETASPLPYASALGIDFSSAPSTRLDATITYKWASATFDSNPERRFKLPTHYKRVAGRDLLKAFTSL
ncbi:MAG: DUF4292 domain-containing protein, partial [Duncaniella sp.]|nr:DUF4292 domain-containing protein [Duncaniella sp.]